jgi:uncharacterized protein YdhG (YjbR/CyaY superfamily)
MANTDFKSVSEYLDTKPKDTQKVLKQVRSIIRKALPKADEVISYQIPAYKLNGTAVIHFAGWKAHYALYPATEKVVQAFAKELVPYELSKGTIRFPLTDPVPVKLIERIVKLRAQETAALKKKVVKKRATKRGP